MPGWPYPRLLAHRGAGTLAPENTLVALQVGHEMGYRGAELDAVLSADEVPVLLHDGTLDRTTSGTGPVDRRTAAELSRLDAGSWMDPRYAGQPVPTLRQALERGWALGLWFNVEIKPMPGREERTGLLVAQVVAAFCAEMAQVDAARASTMAPLLSSFSAVALQAARRAAPQLRRGLLVGRIPAGWQQMLEAVDAFSLHCDHRGLSAARARELRRSGAGLMCYTVNEPERADRLREWGVDAICTDRLDLIGPGRWDD